MTRRTTQLAALLTILLTVAMFAWGCGFGGSGDTPTTIPGTDTTLAPGSGAPTGPVDSLVGTKLATTESTPKECIDAITQAKPIVILFYVPGQSDDAKVLDSVSKLEPSFTGYTFLLYDYKTPDAYGDLSTLLKIAYPPQLVLVDATGTIAEVKSGYLDEGTINQDLVNLGGA